MRIHRVIARAFGPFQGETLELAPGMTVVAGPNESGKTSWHAALRLAVTGLRRGKGPGTAAERSLAERHRPWDQTDRWEVEARLRLDDGRTVDVTQDLANKVACRAVDVDLGRDVSDEILDGTPDASRWLGLDRDSFASTVSVSQAQIMAVADAAEELQDHMQRAAATHGADATAAEAISRLEQFRRDAVGADTVAAKGPLRTAKNRLAALVAARDQARHAHAEFLGRAAEVDATERAARDARLRLAGAEAAVARMQATEAAARATRAAELSARHPSPPRAAATDDDLAARAATAVEAYRRKPAPVELSGPSADAIEAELRAVPTVPDGDTRPHPTVVETQRSVTSAVEGLRLLGDSPPAADDPAPGMDAARLRELAGDLAQPVMAEAADLEAQLQALQSRRTGAPGPTSLLALALAGIGATVGLLVAGQPALALAAAVVAVSSGLAAVVRWRSLLSAASASERAEAAVDPYRRARAAAEERRRLALDAVQRAGLPADPAALQHLADEAATASLRREAAGEWMTRHAAAQTRLHAARDSLATALRERGAEVGNAADAMEAADRYLAACEERATTQQASGRATDLRSQLEARRAAEDAADSASRRINEALEALRAVAGELQIPGTDPEELCVAVETWRAERTSRLRASQQALAEWQQLQSLLDGSTVDELEADAARRRQRAVEMGSGIPPEAIRLPAGGDPEELLTELRREAQGREREHDQGVGNLDAQRSSLPNVAEAEEAADLARGELERVERLAATIDRTLALLRAAQERVHRDLAPVLARAVQRWLPAVSGGAYGEVSVDPASLKITVKESASGQWRDARLLSEGTREQVYLLLRVAMAEHLVSTGESAPLLLDEVTAQCDSDRKRQLLDVLHVLSAERQVILFTHDEEVLSWAERALTQPADALVRLQPRRQAPIAAAAEAGQLRVPLAVD